MKQFEKVLVTGADGFIGSHIVEKLVSLGYPVRAFTMYNSFSSYGWIDFIDENKRGNVEVFPGDIRDPNGVREAMIGCDIVLHLAALIAIPFSYHSPDSYIDVNVKGTLNILQAARKLGVKKIVHTSTSEVYGTAEFVPIDEHHPLKGQSPYSASKIAADQLAYSFYTSFDQPVIILRPFNTFGPRQSARAIIPTIITQLINGKKELKLGELTPTRDFTYIEDTVSGFINAMLKKDLFGEVINLGSGSEISIGKLAELIANILGSEVKLLFDEQRKRPRASEVSRLLSDNSKALSKLDWEPQFLGNSGFRAGLKRTIDWFSKTENLRLYKSKIYNI